jgi:2-keto-4-pentenoate hydratase/2-oxohepta-3-ene-1,7-dioic acid hydratase in catechol pathway
MPEEFVRFTHEGKPSWGLKQAERLLMIPAAPWVDARPTGASVDAKGVVRLAPAEPSKIVCVGVNYRDHALEMGHSLPVEPLIFLKPASSLLDPGESIRIPSGVGRVDYEAELALVIGKKIGPGHEEADALFGFTCANDVTARDLQKKDGQWTRAKGFDTFCPLGPSLVRGLDVSDLAIECRVNKAIKQSSRTSQLVFSPAQVVRFVAGIMTLNPGDVILTGTPGGIGPLATGDEVEVRIQNVGALSNRVL